MTLLCGGTNEGKDQGLAHLSSDYFVLCPYIHNFCLERQIIGSGQWLSYGGSELESWSDTSNLCVKK